MVAGGRSFNSLRLVLRSLSRRSSTSQNCLCTNLTQYCKFSYAASEQLCISGHDPIFDCLPSVQCCWPKRSYVHRYNSTPASPSESRLYNRVELAQRHNSSPDTGRVTEQANKVLVIYYCFKKLRLDHLQLYFSITLYWVFMFGEYEWFGSMKIVLYIFKLYLTLCCTLKQGYRKTE